MTEEAYWDKYNKALKHCTDKDLRCSCCKVIFMNCPGWQQLRLITNPSPSEQSYLKASK